MIKMVYCCVPNCESTSWKKDDTVIFHDFPPNPDIAAKWIKQVNKAINSKTLWFPRAKAVMCNKHFMESAYKPNSIELKPRAMPTIFGQKLIPYLKAKEETLPKKGDFTSSPLIVKVIKPEETNCALQISNVCSQAKVLDSNSDCLTPHSSHLNITVPTQQYVIKPLASSSADNGQNLSENAFYSTVSYIMQNDICPSINVNKQLNCVPNTYPINATKQLQNVLNRNHPINVTQQLPNILNTYPSIVAAQQLSNIHSSNNATQQLSNVSNTHPVTRPLQNISNTCPSTNSTQQLTNVSNTHPSINITQPLQNVSNIHPSINDTKQLQNDSNALNKKRLTKDKEMQTINKKQKINSELIEIAPNTFLKINPEVIKVNKKQTPSGNTVLQFVLNSKMALDTTNSIPPIKFSNETNTTTCNLPTQNTNSKCINIQKNGNKEHVVENVLGHLLDTHTCKNSYSKKPTKNENQDDDDDDILIIENDNIINSNKNYLHNVKPKSNIITSTLENENKDDDDIQILEEKDTINSNKNHIENERPNSNFVINTDPCIAKAPILMTTNMSLNNYMLGRPKHSSILRQKSRLIASLRLKVDKLTKKVEELEDKCIVQERQLSYPFIKRLKSVRKNAAKGDKWATYILEQIRSYSGKAKMRWSDSTLTQCAIWCRKAPYAYEYFKKANLFKLPCLATVKRFRKKHPEINFTNKVNGITINPDDDDDDSSDFTFEDSNSENENQEASDDENFENVPCETILSIPSEATNSNHMVENNPSKKDDSIENTTVNIESVSHDEQISNVNSESQDIENKKHHDENISKINHNQNEMEDNNVEIQEIILSSGEIVQFNSVVCNATENGSQYYIIPAINDQNCLSDHQYSVVTSESLPLMLQNIDSSELPIEQDQLIFITNSTEQIDSTKSQT